MFHLPTVLGGLEENIYACDFYFSAITSVFILCFYWRDKDWINIVQITFLSTFFWLLLPESVKALAPFVADE